MATHEITDILTLCISAYLIGSIPIGWILGKLAGLGDIRSIGSGNIGATNMLRAGGKKLAILTLLLDAAKGYSAAYLGWWMLQDYYTTDDLHPSRFIYELPALGALLAVIGHCYPVWLKFKGGKGVATAFGALLMLSSPYISHLFQDALSLNLGNLGVIVGVTWLVVLLGTGYSSLAALTGAGVLIALDVVAFLLYQDGTKYKDFYHVELLLALLVVFRHRENIRRLLKGEEKKLSLRRSKKEA